MTNGQITILLNTINKIKTDNRTLPVKVSYALNRNYQKLLDAYKPYEETMKDKGYASLTSEQLSAMSEEERQDFLTLYTQEVEIELYKIKLEDIENADLTINEVEAIQTFMLEEE